MKSLPDPSFFLQLCESFIKACKVVGGDNPRLVAKREISAAELATQPNPILQLAGDSADIPINVCATLSLGDTVYRVHSFTQIGFSTLNQFIKESPDNLHQFELGVFDRVNGFPAPTASPSPMELVFCGFNSSAIPELSDAFPNLDASPSSITLSVLDQFKFLKSQCSEGDSVLLVEIGNDKTHLFLINSSGLLGIQTVSIGRRALYEAMAEVLHLHYIGSAVKLFTRSGFDSSELAPKLGQLFGRSIQGAIDSAEWQPTSFRVSGLMSAQSWFLDALIKDLGIKAFELEKSRLPFDIDEAVGEVNAFDFELLAKVFTSLVSDEDFSWHNDYLGNLSKSSSIPRRPPAGSNPPFPTAHPEVTSAAYVETPVRESEPIEPELEVRSPYAPKLDEPDLPEIEYERSKPVSTNRSESKKEVAAIPDHLLNDIEEYDGEFEDSDDYGGGTGRAVVKIGLLVLSVLIVGVIVTIVFFPQASERYLGITPPHSNFDRVEPRSSSGRFSSPESDLAASVEPTEDEVASGIQNLRLDRERASFGGLFLPTNPSGAEVVIGDMEPLTSPVKLPNLAPGIYEVTISKSGYESKTIMVTIKAKEVLKTETVNLERLR